MKIGIIGFGVVGKAVANTLSKGFELVLYDKFKDLDEFEDLLNCDFVFITVPTPFDCRKNKTEDSAVVESLKKLDNLNFSNTVIIKSTLQPGFCDTYILKFNLKIAFNPEFLRESTTPNKDFKEQETVVIGTSSLEEFQSIKTMYKSVLSSKAQYCHTSPMEAEMIKCAQNTMLASRVTLANMIYDACKAGDVNYNKVREIAFDNFEILGPHMVQVPGPDGKRGFGGKCLPKDIRAFSTVINSDLLESIINYNDTLRGDLSDFLKNFKK